MAASATGSGKQVTLAEPAVALDPAALPQGLADLFAQFDTHWHDAAPIIRFAVQDTDFDCRGNAAAYAALVRDGVCATIAQPARHARLLLLDAPGPVWRARYYQEREVEAALRGTPYLLAHDPDRGFWQAFDRSSGRGLQFMRSPTGYPPWEPGSPLRNFLHWQLMGARRGLIHAGTLAVGGRGVLLAGPGGSGKSGTVLAGLLHGLATVGDDYVLADLRDGLSLRPIFRTLKQDPAGAARLGLRLRPRAPNWQGKLQLTVDEVAPAALVQQIVPVALLCPRVAHAPRTTFRPLDAKSAFQALAPSGVSQIPGDRAASFALSAAVTRALPCHAVDLGTDPAEIAAALRDFIDRVSA